MKNQSDYNEKRFRELSDRAYNTNKYYFTDFLSAHEISQLLSMNLNNISIFGGTAGCERSIARFGDPLQICYEEEFPIECIKINPPKFGPKPELTHRDYLGALMGLGLERSTIGDINCTDNCAYVFVCKRIADYIKSELKSVGKYNVNCELSVLPDNALLFKTKEVEVNIASYRCDCIVSAVYNMSRTKSDSYFEEELVFVNGKICSKSDTLSIGDAVSVRHKGKFHIIEECGNSKRGRIFIKVIVYI